MSFDQLIYMNNSVPIVISLWDVSNVFEYATCRFAAIRSALDKSQVSRTIAFRSRFVQHMVWEAERFVFPFINICAISNTSPAMPEYLNDIVKMLTEWQLGLSDDDQLFRKFWTHNFDMAGDVMARYRVITVFRYSWWKDRFDLIPFDMPKRISFEEVRELYQDHMQQMPAGYLLMPDMSRHKGGPDPLLTNVRVIRDDLREFGTQLKALLSKKMEAGRVALEAMGRLEHPVDVLHDAIAASQELLGSGT